MQLPYLFICAFFSLHHRSTLKYKLHKNMDIVYILH